MNALPERAFVIEVIDPDHREWTAMARERGAILAELKSAPVAAAITIYEWVLAQGVNGRNYPVWKLVGTYPWTLEN